MLVVANKTGTPCPEYEDYQDYHNYENYDAS